MRHTRSCSLRPGRRSGVFGILLALVVCVVGGAGCRQIGDQISVRPRALRDVPAERLAFRFEPDLNPDALPPSFKSEEPEEPLASIKSDFEMRRVEERLVRTVVSPDGQRALALYETAETPEGDFRMDLYSSDGVFLRNILPPDLSGTFSLSAAWSPDGQQIAFIGIKNSAAVPPTPEPMLDPQSSNGATTATPAPPATAEAGDLINAPVPTASVAPLIAPVPTFDTEQIYIGDRDGLNLRPLTTRDGLIYFQFAWAPDAHAMAAVACRESEWNARRAENKATAGRPRLISMEGRERLLSDNLVDTPPVWSPDSSKVATAFETDVTIYDALSEPLTAAMITLREPLLAASAEYDARLPQKTSATTEASNTNTKEGAASGTDGAIASPPTNTSTLLSFNPVVRLEWLQPETLLVQTAFLRIYKDEPIKNYPRWHVLRLSPQAAVLTHHKEPAAERSSSMASLTRSPFLQSPINGSSIYGL